MFIYFSKNDKMLVDPGTSAYHHYSSMNPEAIWNAFMLDKSDNFTNNDEYDLYITTTGQQHQENKNALLKMYETYLDNASDYQGERLKDVNVREIIAGTYKDEYKGGSYAVSISDIFYSIYTYYVQLAEDEPTRQNKRLVTCLNNSEIPEFFEKMRGHKIDLNKNFSDYNITDHTKLLRNSTIAGQISWITLFLLLGYQCKMTTVTGNTAWEGGYRQFSINVPRTDESIKLINNFKQIFGNINEQIEVNFDKKYNGDGIKLYLYIKPERLNKTYTSFR